MGSFQNFSFPIHVFYSTDDTISNAKNTQAFWRNVKSTQGINFTELSPQKLGMKKIDHFGYFRRRMKDRLWPEVLKELDGFLER